MSSSPRNGLAERKHRHIREMGLSLLAQSHLPSQFWVDAFLMAIFLINRFPTLVLDHETPFSKLFHSPPDYKILRVFGCACYPLLSPYMSNKLSFKSKQCSFLGFCSNHKGYRCFDPVSQRVYLSRNVVFDETCFLAKGGPLLATTSSGSAPAATPVLISMPPSLINSVTPLVSSPLETVTSSLAGSPPVNPHNMELVSSPIAPATSLPAGPHTTAITPLDFSPPKAPWHPMQTRSQTGFQSKIFPRLSAILFYKAQYGLYIQC